MSDVLAWAVVVFSAVCTGVLIPYVKAKVRAEKYFTMQNWAKTAVEAAEKLYKAEDGPKKLDYALDFLFGLFPGLGLDSARALIEQAVYEVKRAVGN